MKGRLIPRQHLTHSTNPYIHKCCGCVHLRIGSALTCLIWAGLSLYFAIISFQSKSPFYSYLDPTGLYLFGTINIVLFGVSLGTLCLIYLRSPTGMKAASFIINSVVFLLVVDMAANTILFIVRREGYVEWCINTTSAQLNAKFLQDQQSDEFNVNTTDFYNCKRTWEDELKFSVLSTIVMITVYLYLAISIFSYSVKLRFRIKHEIMGRMRGEMMGNIMMPQGPMSTGAEMMI